MKWRGHHLSESHPNRTICAIDDETLFNPLPLTLWQYGDLLQNDVRQINAIVTERESNCRALMK